MHEPVEAYVEQYLAGSEKLPGEFTAHLEACVECRQDVAQMKQQAMLLRSLRVSDEIEPRAGFYGRVLERIDVQRQSSIWTFFLDPAFGRRLALASAALAVMMGVYLVSSEPPIGHNTAVSRVIASEMIPGEDEPGPVLGASPEQDRGAVLVNLVTYQEQ